MILDFRKHFRSIWIFSLCAASVFITQFIILEPVIQYRMFNLSEDWPFLVLYSSLPNPLLSIANVWTEVGLHTTAQIYHIGILSDFLMFNYEGYQVVNVALKALGTITLFPLILVLFKDKRLAFIATILFGMSSATAGSFLWIVKGSEYIGIALMNIFLITYYFVILRNSRKLLLLSSLIFLLAYLMAPPRMFPLLLLIPLIEIYWLLKTRKKTNLTTSIVRATVYILPIILISLPAPVSSCCPFTSRPPILFKDIMSGNWHNLLDPFAGIGWTLFTNDYWKLFTTLEFDTFTNFGSYLSFLMKPTLIFGILTLILSLILARKRLNFFIVVFGLNLVFEILMFFIANDNYHIAENIKKTDSIGHFVYTKYPTIVGIYILVVAFASFLEWRKDRANNLLKAVWIGPVISVIFLWPTWVVMGPLINDYSSTHWYFGIPAMGTTLLLGAILILLYEKLKNRKLFKAISLGVILGIMLIFYQTHKEAITKQYLGINPWEITLGDQQKLHEQLLRSMGPAARNGDLLVYLDIVEDSINLRRTIQYYREALVVHHFGYWVHFMRTGDGSINNGCIDVVTDAEILKSIVDSKEGKSGFRYTGYCMDKPGAVNTKDKIFYGLDNFYALRIQGGDFIDIKAEVLAELGIH